MNYWDIDIDETLNGIELKSFLNKKRILKNLYHHGVLSSSDFMQMLNISAPKANAYLQELIIEGFVENKGKGESVGGRKPNTYGLKKNSVYVVGIDLGRKFLRIAIYNSDMEKLNDVQLDSLPFENREELIGKVFNNTQNLITNTNISQAKIMGIGINMPGLIDSEKGINYTYLYNEELPLAKEFESKFKRPVFLENDTKARTLAEMRYGAAKDHNNALVLQIDWGLGLGMILNGRLYKGNSGFSGEFSHIPINPSGVLCSCGKIGCIETMASGNALARMAKESLETNPNSMLYPIYKTNKQQLMPNEIIKTAHQGDQLSIELLSKVGEALGQGIANLIQILNPEIIVLGGVLAQANDYITTPINHSLYKYCLPKLREDTKIVITPLGNDIGMIGSATVVLENILENN